MRRRGASLLQSLDRGYKPSDPNGPTTTTASSTQTTDTLTKTKTYSITSSRTTPINSRSSSGSTLAKILAWSAPLHQRSISVSTFSSAPAAAPAPRYSKENCWPASLDKECEKSARILKSFCIDGFLALENENIENDWQSTSSTLESTSSSEAMTRYASMRIPTRIIQNAVGLAIFSCVRSGLWMSGSGGSGILISRRMDGTWSSPSGILIHTAELAFVLGVDIYDCVLVINNVSDLELFTRPRTTLGCDDVNLSVGPLVRARPSEDDHVTDRRWRDLRSTVLTYLKARGRHQNVTLDGALVTQRVNENERFYDTPGVDVLDIMAGHVAKDVPETRPILEVVKAAEGRTDFDGSLLVELSRQPAPGDALIVETPDLSTARQHRSPFGIPSADDPDPYGILSLEMAGLEIREAGSQVRRVTSAGFDMPRSGPTSPVFYTRFSFNRNNRQSADTAFSKSNRGSFLSTRTQHSSMTDAYTQTMTPETPSTPTPSEDGRNAVLIKSSSPAYSDISDYHQADFHNSLGLVKRRPRSTHVSNHNKIPRARPLPQGVSGIPAAAAAHGDDDGRSEDADDENDETDSLDDGEVEGEGEEPIVYEVATAAASIRATPVQVAHAIHAKGSLVNIPKRQAPPVPMRSPMRLSRGSSISEYSCASSPRSPLRNAFLPMDGPVVDTPLMATPAACGMPCSELARVSESPEADTQQQQRQPWQEQLTEHYLAKTATEAFSQPPPSPNSTTHTSSIEESDHEPPTPTPTEVVRPRLGLNTITGQKTAVAPVTQIDSIHLESF